MPFKILSVFIVFYAAVTTSYAAENTCERPPTASCAPPPEDTFISRVVSGIVMGISFLSTIAGAYCCCTRNRDNEDRSQMKRRYKTKNTVILDADALSGIIYFFFGNVFARSSSNEIAVQDGNAFKGYTERFMDMLPENKKLNLGLKVKRQNDRKVLECSLKEY